MKLQELNQTNSNLSKQQIVDWLKKYNIKNYIINSDLSVDVDGDVELQHASLNYIPVQFNIVRGSFYCSGYNNLTSLEGCPQSVGESFDCSGNNLTSLEGAPRSVVGSFQCGGNNLLTSLHNIHKQIRSIGTFIWIPTNVKSHILGLVRIKGLEKVRDDRENNEQLLQAIQIINNNLQGKGNIHQAQEQLLDAGLKEFAQL